MISFFKWIVLGTLDKARLERRKSVFDKIQPCVWCYLMPACFGMTHSCEPEIVYWRDERSDVLIGTRGMRRFDWPRVPEKRPIALGCYTFHSPPYSWKFYSILMFILPGQTLRAVCWSYSYPHSDLTLIMLRSRHFDEEAQNLYCLGLRTVVKGPFLSILLWTLAKPSRANAVECTGHSGQGVLRQSIREGSTDLA